MGPKIRVNCVIGRESAGFGPPAANEIARAVVYLLSADAKAVTGQTLILGGRAFTRAMYRASRDLQEQIGHMSTAVRRVRGHPSSGPSGVADQSADRTRSAIPGPESAGGELELAMSIQCSFSAGIPHRFQC